MNAQLIYDVGAHLGEDVDFYLRKGFKVVAIEANPVLAERLRERFRSNLSDGSLSMVDAAIAEKAGEVDFYVNQSNSVWGTIRPEWAERNAILGAPSRLVRVKAITFPEVLSKHGVPYYLKIDIEGADVLCLAGLIGKPDRPKFVSIESEKRSWNALLHEFETFKVLGYSRFKIVDQRQIDRQKPLNPAAEGHHVEHRFEPFIRKRTPWKMVDCAPGNSAIQIHFSQVSPFWRFWNPANPFESPRISKNSQARPLVRYTCDDLAILIVEDPTLQGQPSGRRC